MHSHATPSRYVRLTIQFFLLTLFAGFLPMTQITEALQIVDSVDFSARGNPGGGLSEIRSVDSVETRFGLVAILVEDEVWSASTSGSGFFSFLGTTKLSQKIQTYAEDVQSALPWTKSLIITVSDEDTPVEIQRLLEQFYFEGNPNDSDHTALIGVVLVGDVPLPVVNKNGNRFISLLPYTDFEEPAYLLDADTQDFLPNPEAQNLQNDIWHGVIVPPLDGQEGMDLLSVYFDKNHEFHSGNEDYTTFDQKIFIGDWITEQRAINPTAFAAYQRFLSIWEELAYYRYTNDLVEELFTDMQASVEPGDQLDNDGDGSYDEEAQNGIDDDGDGLVDEDLGDGFFGIDNDGDCYDLPSSSQDGDGDGIGCYGQGDPLVDEDGFDDNNNDLGQLIELYLEGDADIYEDRLVDEDPPGDTTGGEDEDGDGVPDGDGCPGLCGVDDNGDAEDHDQDGFPTGWEVLYGYNWTDEKRPWFTPEDYVSKVYGQNLSFDEASAFLADMFIDGFFIDEYQHDSCFASDGSYHPEWDDDEDGFCDEDGSEELIEGYWAAKYGVPSGECAYNDADCDGEIDEDPTGFQPEGLFDNLPDIQAKSLTESLIKRYVGLFEQPQGVWNRLINETGRYGAQATDADGKIQNDYDTSISLIAKKDEYVLQYLALVNDHLEDGVDEILKDNLVANIPIIAGLEIEGKYTTYEENEDGEKKFGDPEEFCEANGNVNLDGKACLQFINHSGFDKGLFDDEKRLKKLSELGVNDYFISGSNLWEIDNVGMCTTFAGTDEEDGQLVQFNSMYSRKFSAEHADMNKQEVQDYRNCVPEYYPYIDDIPEVCDEATTIEAIRTLDGAKNPKDDDEDVDTSRWEVGAEACYEFRELETFDDYTQRMVEFNNWLTGKIRKFRKNDDSDDEETYEAFLEKVEEKRLNIEDSKGRKPAESTLRKHFSELDIFAADEDHSYTMIDLLKEKGVSSNPSDDDVDTYIAARDGAVTVYYPKYGSGMDDIYKLEIDFDILYLNENGSALSTSRSGAKEISSFYRHTEPKPATLNAQINNAGSPNLPIDATRRASFIDNAGEAQTIAYVNVFDTETVEDVEAQIMDMAADVAAVEGGGVFESDVKDLADTINWQQLEDALIWRTLSIDEKHEYILTHYLGTEEPIVAKARDGYEIGSIIVDGSATELYFGFNGDRPLTEEDLEWQYRSEDLILAALDEANQEAENAYEPLSEVSNTTPVVLSEWLEAIKEWFEELEDSLSSRSVFEGQEFCSESFDLNLNVDEDGDGLPDGSLATVSLTLSSDDANVLQAGGGDYYTVAVSAKEADGSINGDDNYTEVSLDVVSGEDSVTILGNSTLKLTGGVATFTLESADAGNFSLRASASNRSDVRSSNTLSGAVESKYVLLTSYYAKTTAGTEEAVKDGDQIEVFDVDGSVRAVLDPMTGDLDLRGVEAEWREASVSLPTRLAVLDGEDTLAVFFVIPEVKNVAVGSGTEGVFVSVVAPNAGTASAEDGLALEVDDEQMGLLTALGQIAVAEGYRLEFDDPANINLYDPIHVLGPDGSTLFTVSIGHSFEEGSIEEESGEHEDFLSKLWRRFKSRWLLAAAETVIPDTDADLLDDLEEWVIGTDWEDRDSDDDTYLDGTEIFASYDPLAAGEKLFTDIDATHEAYHDLAVLYLRGVVKGYSDGSFRPDNPITREEFMKIDLGAICKSCDSYSESYKGTLFARYEQAPFPDTDINPELLACVAEGKVEDIVSGYAGGSYEGYFLPRQNISRAEASKVLVETAGWEVDELLDGEQWYAAYVRTAQSHDLFPEGVTANDAWLQASITRAEFVMMAVNVIEANDCRELGDSDGGGLDDLEEIHQGTDPLDAADDYASQESDAGKADEETVSGGEIEDFSDLSEFEHDAGVYAVSDQAQYEQIVTDEGEGSASVNIYTDEVAADGESSLVVRAEIRDQNGNVYTKDSRSVIEFILSSSEYGELSRSRVQVSAGVAESTFTASTLAGTLTVEGRISDGSLPSQNAELYVYPGSPVRLDLQGASSVLPAGGESASDMAVYFYDSFGNVAGNGFYTVTLNTDGGLSLLDLRDEDTTTEGTQVTTSDGYIEFRVLSSTTVGIGTVSASLQDGTDSGDTFTIENTESLKLKISKSQPYMLAGGTNTQTVTVTVVDELGAPVSGFQGDVELSLSDPGYGSFATETVTLLNGQASSVLSPGTLAGTGSIIAESAGIEGGSSPLVIKPAGTYELRIQKTDGTTVLAAGERERFVIQAYDEYGNVVNTDSSTTGTLRLTESTEEYGSLSSSSFTLNQGQANFSLNVDKVSGTVNMVAASTGLLAGTWGGTVNYTVTGEALSEQSPQMLYMSLLGGPFGDVTQENYVGGWLTFNGRTQAMTTLVSEPTPKKRRAGIDARGTITLAEDGLISQTVSAAGSELPMRIQWRSFPDDALLGELFFVLSDAGNQVSAELLTTSTDFNLDEGNGGIVLREDSAAVAKLRDDGQIVLMDPAYSLVVNGAADGLSIVLLKTTAQIALFNYDGDWTEDVSLVSTSYDLEDWDTESAGIYIKPTASSEHHFTPIPTGNSSLNPMGLALIEPEQDLAKDMQPSLGYQSLEKAEEDGTIGWEKENKHILAFAAGNTVGQSNLFYGSEVGIVLGDPTISLPTLGEVNSLGFTTDIGTPISASQEDVLTLMNMDYNGDGMEDILVAYKDRIEVLQNAKAPVRLKNRGEILYLENGISSIDKGDFNNDGLPDLLIVTEESCYADEMCIYVYKNIGGGFVAENLTLEDIAGKPKQVEVADLNNDDYDDLVLVDENLVLYTVWNAEGTLDTVDKIKDFGLNADPSENLYADIVLHTDAMIKGSVSLPILTTEVQDSDSSIDGDLSGFVSSLGLDDDFELTVDGQGGGATITRRVNQAFEYAENLTDEFSIQKTVTDGNGGTVAVGDTLTYSITITNNSGGSVSELYLSDTVGSLFGFDEDSFECLDCDGVTDPKLSNGNSERPYVFGPVHLTAGGSVSFEYEATVRALPDLSIMVGQDIYSDYKDDNYADIAISIDGNTTGELMVYYSDGYITERRGESFMGFGGSSYRRVSYQDKLYSPDDSSYAEEYDTTTENPFGDENEDGIPDFMENMDADKGIPVSSGYDPIAEILGGEDVSGAYDEDGNEIGDGYYSTDEMFASDNDADNDGLYDLVDLWNSGTELLLDPKLDLSPESDDVVLSDETMELEASIGSMDEEIAGAVQKIEEVVAMFTCNGGCIAFPGSVAFLAPGNYHVPITGTTISFDPGTPVFGILPYLPVVCTGQMCYAAQVMRLYLAPTTTLGLGLGICIGPYGVGQCFAFNIPLLQALGVCDAINGFISDSLSKASDFVSGEMGSVFNVSGKNGADPKASGLGSGVFEGYSPPVATNVNIQVPGFPSVFTEWLKAQKEELFKMLDLPDITFIYPDPASFTTEFTGLKQKMKDAQTSDIVQSDGLRKVEELKSGVLGLEKWLNVANSLPLIDIKPEPVTIRYPNLTPEEIEIVMADWEAWLQDTKTKLARFKEQFALRRNNGTVSAFEEEVYGELEDTMNEVITAMEANLAVIESYREIPEKILIIRDLESYYAKVIICYIDAILSTTAGYFQENMERVEAWAQWAWDMTAILDGWKLIIDLTADFMDSCDKCTNQRYSGLQLLFSLFVFIPEPPVIKLPKLPDIVIDVSNIQAGIDIIWPDINFVPEPINIPELPRIYLPSGEITAELDLDIEIPTLPGFEVNFVPPDLPPLTLPDLPSLPPPPAIPAIDPTLKASLNIVSNILKIVCIIRQGFIPTPEFTLKSKIEEITERPGDIVLPFDLAITVEWPEYNFDFVKEIRVNTFLNLELDFSVLYDLLKSIGDESNKIVGETMNEAINTPLQELADALQEIISVLNVNAAFDVEAEVDAGVDGVEASGSAEGDVDLEEFDSEELEDFGAFNEAMNTATAYRDHPLVKQEMMALNTIMEQLQNEVALWAETLPNEVRLEASEHVLSLNDPLLNRYDEIIKGTNQLDANFLASIHDTPLSAAVTLRDSLISYVDDLEQGTKALRGMDGESFNRYLAQESIQNPIQLASSGKKSFSTSAGWLPDKWVTEDPWESQIALAEETDAVAVFDGLDFGGQAQAFNTGIYLYNAEAGISERLVDYTQEADEAVSIVYIDLDDDGDEDLVYSLGGDVYFKENHDKSASLRYLSSDPEQSSVEELDPGHGAVHNFRRGKNDNNEASFSFRSADTAVGYDISFYDSLDAQEAAPDENIKRLLLLEDSENAAMTFYDEDGVEYNWGTPLSSPKDSATYQANSETSIVLPEGMEYNLPQIKNGRLRVTNVKGQATLKKGAKRIPLSENAELNTEDAVILQTLEESLLKVTEGGETLRIELPAYAVLSLGRGNDRTIRLESGSGFWIQAAEIAEEQGLREGMVILAEEMITLDSSRASVTLETSEGAELILDNEELFVMDSLLNPSSPSASIDIENGAYYTTTRGLFEDGSIGPLSDNILLNPQICGDDSPPYPIVEGGRDEVDIAIFSTMEISAESSFDSDSSIADAWWDLDDTVDADGDGIANNDEEVIGLTAEIGPYEDLDARIVTLTVADEAGNSSTAEVQVNIYVPEITLTKATTAQVSGNTDPASPEFPFHLVRERAGAVTELGDGYATDEYGEFTEEMVDSDLLSVFNADNEVIAEWSPITKQLLVYNGKYSSAVLPAENDWPSRLVVYEKSSGTIMASFIFVENEDQGIYQSTEPLEDVFLSGYERVTVYPVLNADAYEWTDSLLTARDEYGSLDFMLSETGNITVFDDRYRLVKHSANSLDEHLIIEVYDRGVLELEIWPGASTNSSLVSTDELGLSGSVLIGGTSLSADTRLYFEDISTSDPLYDDIAELVERGVLEGYDINGLRYFKPDQAITRAEFTKIVLSILCIVPSDEAYLLPAMFTDILSTDLWYYAVTKESFLRLLITGYLGEVNSAGVAPFKPDKTITRAEAAKIMLEALDKEGIITLPEDLFGEPWYEPYMEVAQDLNPYLTGAETAGDSNFIVTGEEAADPNHLLTRYEFVEMSVRVLRAYNCFDLDSDGDGLVNYDEENTYDTDPYNPDTDSGGVDDGTEVGRGTDPLDGEDDFEDGSIATLDPGTYAVTEACSACPCISNIDYNADLREGDKVFAIIQNEDGEIFGTSNTLTVTE